MFYQITPIVFYLPEQKQIGKCITKIDLLPLSMSMALSSYFHSVIRGTHTHNSKKRRFVAVSSLIKNPCEIRAIKPNGHNNLYFKLKEKKPKFKVRTYKLL